MDLANLPSDETRLWLHDTDITDEGLKHLSALSHLTELSLAYTSITGEGLSICRR